MGLRVLGSSDYTAVWEMTSHKFFKKWMNALSYKILYTHTHTHIYIYAYTNTVIFATS